MKKQATSPESKPEETVPEPFWTWDIKILVIINIVFLAVITAGLVWVFKILGPQFVHHIERWWQSLSH